MKVLERYRWWMVGSFLILNFLDMVFTMHAVGSGLAEEANPVMAWVLSFGNGAFMAVKCVLPVGATLFLGSIPHKSSLVSLVVINLVYGLVVANQVYMLTCL